MLDLLPDFKPQLALDRTCFLDKLASQCVVSLAPFVVKAFARPAKERSIVVWPRTPTEFGGTFSTTPSQGESRSGKD